MDDYMHPFRGGPGQRGGPGFLMDGPHHHGPGPLGWAIFALQLVLVIGVVWLVASSFLRGPRLRFAGGPGFRHFGMHGPADVLDLRYARGEVSREEYLQTRQDLGGPPGAPPPPPEAPTQG